MTDPRARQAALALSAVTVVWGSTFALTKDVVTDLPVSSFLLWRFGIAVVALAAFRPNSVRRLSARDRRRAVLVGLIVFAGFALQSVGLQHTSATTSGFITGMFVVLTPLMSGLLFRDRVPARAWAGIALATAGLATIALRGWSVGGGELLTLLGALAFAVEIAVLSRWSTPQNAYGLTVIELGVAGLGGLLLTTLDGGPQLPGTASAWAGLVFLALAASAIAFCVQAWSQAHLSATRTAVIMTGEPVWAGVAGVLLVGDSVTPRLVVGGLLIIAAMILVEAQTLRWPLRRRDQLVMALRDQDDHLDVQHGESTELEQYVLACPKV